MLIVSKLSTNDNGFMRLKYTSIGYTCIPGPDFGRGKQGIHQCFLHYNLQCVLQCVLQCKTYQLLQHGIRVTQLGSQKGYSAVSNGFDR